MSWLIRHGKDPLWVGETDHEKNKRVIKPAPKKGTVSTKEIKKAIDSQWLRDKKKREKKIKEIQRQVDEDIIW